MPRKGRSASRGRGEGPRSPSGTRAKSTAPGQKNADSPSDEGEILASFGLILPDVAHTCWSFVWSMSLSVMMGGIRFCLLSIAKILDNALHLIGIAFCTLWEGCTSWWGTREDISSLTFVKDILPWFCLALFNMNFHGEDAVMFIIAMEVICILTGNGKAFLLLFLSLVCVHEIAVELQQKFVQRAIKGWSAKPDVRDLSIFWVFVNIVAHLTTGIITGRQAAEEQCNGIIFPWEGKLEAVDDASFQQIITCRWPWMALLKGSAFKVLRDRISELLCEMHTRRDDPNSKTFSCTYQVVPTQISTLFCLPVTFAYIFWTRSRKITWWDFIVSTVAPVTCFGGGLMGMYQFYKTVKTENEMGVMAKKYFSILFMFGFFFFASHLEIAMMHINDDTMEKMLDNMENWWTAMFGIRFGFNLQVARYIRYLGLMCACSSYELWRADTMTQLCLCLFCGPCVARYMFAAEGVVQMSRIVIQVYFPWSSLEAERMKLVHMDHPKPGTEVGYITNECVPLTTRLYCRAVDHHGMDPKSAGHAAVTIDRWEHNFRTNRSKQNCKEGTHQYRFYRYMQENGFKWIVRKMMVAWVKTSAD